MTFGRLTRWQRVRRLVEDVLAGCGFSEAYTSTFVAEGDLRLPQPISQEAAALRTSLVGEPRRGGARQRRGRRHRGRALRDRAHVPRRAASCRTSAGTSPASSTAASPTRSGRSSSSTRRSRSSRRSNATTEPLLHPGKAARTGGGLGRRAAPVGARRRLGRVRARPRRARRARARGRRVRGGEPVPGGAAGSRVRRRRRRAGGRAARGACGRPGAPELRSASVFDEYRGEQIGDGQEVARVPRRVRLARAHAHRRGGRGRPRPHRRGARASASARSCAREQSDPAAPCVSAAWGSGSSLAVVAVVARSARRARARADNPVLTGDVGLERRVHDHAERRGGEQGDAPRRRHVHADRARPLGVPQLPPQRAGRRRLDERRRRRATRRSP